MRFLQLFIILFMATQLSSAEQKSRAVGVYVVDVKKQVYSDEIQALGTLQANEQVTLSSSVTEIIETIHFEDNQRVKKGDLLVKLDTREELAELAEQEAKLSQAQQQLKRLTPLASRGATSQTLIDEARMEVDTTKARIKAIKARISLRQIRSPFDGILGLRDVSVGSLIQAGGVITTVDDDSVMKLDFTIPSLYLTSVKKGLKITATSKAFADKEFSGVVSAISSRIDPISRSVEVRALIKNDSRILKPGLLMHVKIQTNKREKIVIPEICIVSNNTQNSVFVVEKNNDLRVAKKRKVKIGGRKKGYVEIVSGLSEGERIISDGLVKVKQNTPVKIMGVEKAGKN
jgi:membrane fusion protein (multidrug efflux system)